MPSIAQQDYKVIAPKPGRGFTEDAAALGELKRAVLNGIGFDCLLKDTLLNEDTYDRILGVYENGSVVDAWSVGDGEPRTFNLPYTVTQYQGLAAVQEAIDEYDGALLKWVPRLFVKDVDGVGNVLKSDDPDYFICVDGKYLLATRDYNDYITLLEKAESGPAEGFINITWEDALKLIGIQTV